MEVDDIVMDILSRWSSASTQEVEYVKTFFMPKDDVDKIKMKVIEHPDVRRHNNKDEVFISWYDIEVFESNSDSTTLQRLCDIVVCCALRTAMFIWN